MENAWQVELENETGHLVIIDAGNGEVPHILEGIQMVLWECKNLDLFTFFI